MSEFLIDRFAMGLDFEYIAAEFEALYGLPLTKDDADKILEQTANYEDRIKQRELEIREYFSSRNFLLQLSYFNNIVRQRLDEAVASNRSKDIISYLTLLAKSIDTFHRALDSFKKKEEQKIELIQQNNYYIFEEMQKDGIITILDKKKAKRMLGAPEDDDTIKVEA